MVKMLLVSFMIFFSCSNYALFAQKTNLVIDLKQEFNNDIEFDDDLVDLEFAPIMHIPGYNQAILKHYSGIPKCDSLKVFVSNIDNIQFYFDLYRENYFEKKKFLKFIHERKIDTLRLSQTPIKQTLVAVVGFDKNVQFIITDANQNKNFGDDIRYEFNTDALLNSEGNIRNLSKLSLSSFTYEVFSNGKVNTYNRKLIPYPNSNSVFAQRMSLTDKKYLSFLKFRDHWKGSLHINNKEYNFYIQATDNEYSVIYFKEKEISLSKTDRAYNRQFMKRLRDTIIINNNNYVLDSLNNDISKLYLTLLKTKPNHFGNSIGKNIKNFELRDLENNPFKIVDISKQKKYTLIEFWGTWCGPCREIMPKVKNTAVTFSSKLNMISIAFDSDVKKVAEFATKHEMNWANAFLDKNKDNPIINDLKIQAYPTFILIDSAGKIVWRGATDSFDEILRILSNR